MVCNNHIRRCGFSIPACTPGFLKILLGSLGETVVYYGPDRTLVHAQTVGRSGNEYAVLRFHEPLLDVLTHLLWKAGMVEPDADILKFHRQGAADHLGIGSGSAEDDCRTQACPGEFQDRLGAVQGFMSAVDYVGPVGIGLDYQGF